MNTYNTNKSKKNKNKNKYNNKIKNNSNNNINNNITSKNNNSNNNNNEWIIEYDKPIFQECKISKGIYKCRTNNSNEKDEDKNPYAVKIIDKENFNKINLKQIDYLINLNNQGNNNSNIVKFYGYKYDNENNQLFIYMEYLDGYKSIETLLKNEMMGQFTEFEMIFIIKQLINGLIYLHDNSILHRDIIGDNILLNTTNGNIKLVDFCYSNMEPSNNIVHNITSSDSSKINMATENCESSPLCIKSDIWCIGNLLKQMSGGSNYMNNDNLSTEFKNFIEKCLILNPSVYSKSIDLIKLELSNIDLFHSDITIDIHPFVSLYFKNDYTLKAFPNEELESIKSYVYDFPPNQFIKNGQYLSSATYNQQLLPNSIPDKVALVYLKSYNNPLCHNSIPDSVTYLHLPSFNYPINSNNLPSSIRYLILESYDHQITINTFPTSLTDLTLKSYSHPLNINCLHKSIQKLSLPLFKRNQSNNKIINNLEKNNINNIVTNIVNNIENIANINSLKNNKSQDKSLKRTDLNNHNNNKILELSQTSNSEFIINAKHFDPSGYEIPNTIKSIVLKQFNQPLLSNSSIPNNNNIESLTLLLYNHPISSNTFPKSIQTLIMDSFDQIISNNTIPSSVSKLIMKSFNKPISPFSLPDSIEYLELESYNQPLLKDTLPKYLKSLNLHSFNQTIEYGSIPKSITELSLYSYNQPISLISFPETIVELSLYSFNQFIEPETLPKSITTLKLDSFNQKISYNSITDNIQNLFLDSFNHQLESNTIPCSVVQLSLSKYNKDIPPLTLPNSIQTLSLGSYNCQLCNGTIPLSTTHLSLPIYNQKVLNLPKSVQHLEIQSYNHDLDEDSIPESVTTLILGQGFDFNLYGGNLPDSILQLKSSFNFKKPLKKQNNIPRNVQILILDNYNQPIIKSSIPITVQSLTLGSDYQHFSSLENLSTNIVNLTFGVSNPKISEELIKSYIPKSISNVIIKKN